METIPSAPKYSQPFYQDIISRFSSSTTEVMPQTSSQQIAIPINSTSTYDTFTDPSSIVDTNSQQQHQFYCPCCRIPWTRYNVFLNHLNNRHFVNPIRCRQPICSRTFVDLSDYLDMIIILMRLHSRLVKYQLDHVLAMIIIV
uniref:C2H2-type domain-containing protein n=1 Tax=Acrobeloides nanus TaxID=290746 RepID=A0A914C1A4_9BILA